MKEGYQWREVQLRYPLAPKALFGSKGAAVDSTSIIYLQTQEPRCSNTTPHLRLPCTHQQRRTKWKAVPGRGGGGWLQRGWGLGGGSGTRASVRSPVYAGLTASVSKTASRVERGGEQLKPPEKRLGRKLFTMRSRWTEPPLKRAWALGFRFGNVSRTAPPTSHFSLKCQGAGQLKKSAVTAACFLDG